MSLILDAMNINDLHYSFIEEQVPSYSEYRPNKFQGKRVLEDTLHTRYVLDCQRTIKLIRGISSYL